MSKLFNWAAARLVAAFAFALPLAAMAVTTAGYTDFGDTAGVVLWRGTEANFHASTVIDVAEDGTLGEPYAMTADNSATSWQRFARGQSAYTSPGMVLVYDTPGSDQGYKYNPDCTFTPISFGGMWVKTLDINGQPFSILGNNAGKRYTEFGASDKSTLFKFDASFTINRTSTTTFFGEATVDIADGATFTAQADSNYRVVVDSAATLKLKGPGTLAVTTMDVAGTLDLSETTHPAIAGNVTLEGTIVLPAGTEVSPESPFTVCLGTLTAVNVNVKIGDAEAVVKRLTTSGGTITALGDPVYEYTENYPTLVPAGQVYTFIGGDTAETATTASGVTVNGTLKTRGYISLSGITTAQESLLEVVDGTATVTASSAQALSGDIKIDAGATMVNATTADALNYGWGVYVYVYGTLDMGSTRWTVGSNARIYLYEGGLITGAGQESNGAIDITSANVRVIAYGDSSISANMRVRASNIPVEAVEGKTLTISGLINDGVGYSQPGSITKQNSGTLVLTTAPTFTKALKLEAGTLELGGTAASASVTVAASAAIVAASSGSTLTGELIFDSHIPSATNKALIASEAFNGAVVLTGTISSAADITGLGNEVTLRDFTGFLDKSASTSGIKVNVEGTFTQSNGWSYDADRIYLAEIKGNGTMTQSGSQAQLYEVGSIENFTGTFNLSKARIKSNNNAVLDKAQTIATLTVAKTLTVNGGSLTGNLVANNVAVTVDGTPTAGDVLVPVSGTASVSGTVTVNGNKAVVECVTGEGVKFVAYLVSVNVPKVANTTIEVSVGGTPVTPATEGETTNTYSVAEGAMVTVTYSSDDYEVSGGSFEFTATDGYTVNTAEVVTKQYVASITVGETTTKYSSLQAAVDAVAQNKDIVLLGSVVDGATVAREVTFNVVPGEYTYGDIVAGGNYILTTTALEGKTRYTFAQAVIAVTINEVRTLYTMMTANTGIEAANAGPIGTTIEILSGDPAAYVEYLPMFDLNADTGIFTKVANPVAAVYDGVLQVQVYRSLAEAVAAATAGQTVTLLADDHVSFSLDNLEIAISKALTIDGAGYTVYGVNDYAYDGVHDHDIYISGSGDVTIKNVTLANFAGGVGNNMRTYPIWTGQAYEGTLTLDNVTVQNFNRTAFNLNGGTVVVTNCTITGDTTKEAYFQEGIGVYNANVTIVDTAISNVGSNLEKEDSQIAACIQLGNPNGSATGTGSITVVNGTYSGEYGIIVASNAQNTVSVQGGTFVGGLMVEEGEGGNIAVSGGTFDAAVPAEYCATGYEPTVDGDGNYTVRIDMGWIYEASGIYKEYTGTWSNEVEYVNGKAHIEDGNTYTANRPSDGRMVTVEMTLSFDEVNDDDEGVGDAKAAVKLATGGFKVYTSEGPDGAVTSVWKSVTIDELDLSPQVNEDYTFLFVLDLTNTTYTAALITGDGAATNALVLTDGSVANIPFASRGNVAPVQKIEFIGSGSVTSIEGSYEDVPVPEGFVEDEVVTLAGDDTATLTAAQATWLNQFGVKLTVAARLAELSSAQFTAAYLLNLDIMGTFSYTFNVKGFGFETVNETECAVVTVTLTRTGALTENEKAKPIVGTLKLKGTATLGTEFTVIDEAAVADDDFSEGNTTTITLDKGDAKFFQPVIE